MLDAGDVIRVRTYCYSEGQLGMNVLHFAGGAVSGPGLTEADMAAYFDQLLSPLYIALLSLQANYIGVTVQRVLPAPPGPSAVSRLYPGSGAVTGDALPTQTCGIISVRDIVGGTKGHGRVYIPFPAEGDSGLDAAPSAGYIVRATNLAVGIAGPHVVVVGPSAQTWTFRLLHRNPLPFPHTLVGSVRPLQAWATQRRRGAFGKPNPLPF